MPEENKIPDEELNGQDVGATEEAAVTPEETEETVCGNEETAEACGAGEQEEEKSGKKPFFAKKAECGKEVKELKKKNEELSRQAEEAKDRYLRMAADFDNFKRRTAKENETRYLDTKAEALKAFLPIVDNFERAVKSPVPEEAKAYTQGYELIYQMFLEVLKQNNVEEIEAVGREFDPNLHSAVMHVEDETLGENTVAEVFEKGYRMGDRILRYAVVKVAN